MHPPSQRQHRTVDSAAIRVGTDVGPFLKHPITVAGQRWSYPFETFIFQFATAAPWREGRPNPKHVENVRPLDHGANPFSAGSVHQTHNQTVHPGSPRPLPREVRRAPSSSRVVRSPTGKRAMCEVPNLPPSRPTSQPPVLPTSGTPEIPGLPKFRLPILPPPVLPTSRPAILPTSCPPNIPTSCHPALPTTVSSLVRHEAVLRRRTVEASLVRLEAVLGRTPTCAARSTLAAAATRTQYGGPTARAFLYA